MSERQPYSRVYWTIRSDERLAGIYPSDAHLATWLRLLIAADMAWPAPADIPASVSRRSLSVLADAGVIEVRGSLFTFHGLDTERGRRRASAQDAAAHRNPTERRPNGHQTVTEPGPDGLLDETRRDETSQDKDETSRDTAGATIDPADAYWTVTGRYPTEKALQWIDSLADEFGAEVVSRTLAAEHQHTGTQNLLGRVQDVLRRDAHQINRKEAAAERARIAEKRRSGVNIPLLTSAHNMGRHADPVPECPYCREGAA